MRRAGSSGLRSPSGLPGLSGLALFCGLGVAAAAACSTVSDPESVADAGTAAPAPLALPRDCTDEAAVQAAIFAPRCATADCHTGPSPTGALDLGRAGVGGRVLGKPATECGGQTLVAEGAPERSFLVDKVASAKPACGSRMPQGRAALSEDEIACIRTFAASLRSDGGAKDAAHDAPHDASVDTGPAPCAANEDRCDGACVDTLVDPMHCGGCGQPCPAACSGGACVDVCPPDTTDCSGACVDTTTSPDHCGTCGFACPEGKTCMASQCVCPPVSFGTQLQPILSASCAGNNCHSGAMPRAQMNLTAGRAYASLVGGSSSTCPGYVRVVPGDVDSSYLMNKLTGVGMCSGDKMPLNGVLGTDDIALFRAWICNGAPDN